MSRNQSAAHSRNVGGVKVPKGPPTLKENLGLEFIMRKTLCFVIIHPSLKHVFSKRLREHHFLSHIDLKNRFGEPFKFQWAPTSGAEKLLAHTLNVLGIRLAYFFILPV